MPSVPMENAEEIRKFLGSDDAVAKNDGVYKMKSILRDNAPEGSEEYRCPALDENKGCTLPPELKPLECSMWPLRVMSDKSRIYITLACGCNAVDEEFADNTVRLLVRGLSKKIARSAAEHKEIIKEYDDSYRKLIDITGVVLSYEQ